MIDFFSVIASAAPELTNIIGKFINILYEAIGGSFGWTVVVFTLILKIAMSPLDVWQKLAQRKQSRSMTVIQPQMAKLQKQYANNPDMLKQKQMELYREAKLGPGSMLGMCLPMIVTMIIFFVVFSGFNAMVRYQNEMIVYDVAKAYMDSIAAGAPLTAEQLSALYIPEKWLWIENIFMPDTWSNVIPTLEQYIGSGLGQVGASKPDIANWPDWYNTIVGPAASSLNKASFWKISNWNGYFILPIMSIVLSVLSSKAMQATGQMPTTGTTDQQKANKTSQKVMMIVMPIMMGVFSMFYSAAFCIYMIVSSAFSSVFGISFNLINKKKDKKFKEEILEKTYRK